MDVSLEDSDSLLVCIGECGRVVCTVRRSFYLSGDLARVLPTLDVGELNFDLNFDNDPDSSTKDFLNLMSKFGYFNTILSPTRFGCTRHPNF